jgi:small neutral amino acid transporter SnatA (MarC family)
VSYHTIAIIFALLVVVTEAVDLIAANYIIKTLGAKGEYAFWRWDIFCLHWLGAWWVWRIGIWTLIAAGVAWSGLSSAGAGALAMVITMASRNIARAVRVSRTK